MAIYKMLEEMNVAPERKKVLTEAYEATLKKLRLVDRTDPVTRIIASTIIDVARTQNGDPVRISALTITRLGIANGK